MMKFAAIACALACAPAALAAPFPLRLEPRAAIVVDGADDDWPAVFPFELGSACQVLSGPPAPAAGPLTPSARVRALVDGRNLCIYAEFRDATPMRNAMRGNELYKGDCLEVFLRTGEGPAGGFGEADAQFGIAVAEGARSWIWGARSGELSGYRAVVRATAAGAVLEARVPLSNFFPAYEPAEGGRLRVDFAFDESATGAEREARLVWHGGDAAWRDPGSWGDCVLAAGNAAFLAPAILVPAGIVRGPERCFAYAGGKPWTGGLRVDGARLDCDAAGMFIADYRGAPFAAEFLGELPVAAIVYGPASGDAIAPGGSATAGASPSQGTLFAPGASTAEDPSPSSAIAPAASESPAKSDASPASASAAAEEPRSVEAPSTTRFRALLEGCLSAGAPDAASLALLLALAEREGAKLDVALGVESGVGPGEAAGVAAGGAVYLDLLEPSLRALLAREFPAGTARVAGADRGGTALLAGVLALGARLYADRDGALAATLKSAAFGLAESLAAPPENAGAAKEAAARGKATGGEATAEAADEILFCYAEVASLTGDAAWTALATRAGYAVAACGPLAPGDFSALAASAIASDPRFPGYARKRSLLQLRGFAEAAAKLDPAMTPEGGVAGAPRAAALVLAARWFARDGAIAAARAALSGIDAAAADKAGFRGAELAFLAGWLAAEAGE